MAIYVTGDTHGNFTRFYKRNLDMNGVSLTKDDYVIIAGDFGGFWDNSEKEWKNLQWLAERPWTTLFIDGNHENFSLLDILPDREMFGSTVGCAHEGKIYHLRRGHIYTIEDKNFFTVGGGLSIDKSLRVENVSWWEREALSDKDLDLAWSNINSGKRIDYVITHSPPARLISNVYNHGEKSRFHDLVSIHLQDMFDVLTRRDSIRKFFYGHFHDDHVYFDKYHALYYDIVKV